MSATQCLFLFYFTSATTWKKNNSLQLTPIEISYSVISGIDKYSANESLSLTRRQLEARKKRRRFLPLSLLINAEAITEPQITKERA